MRTIFQFLAGDEEHLLETPCIHDKGEVYSSLVQDNTSATAERSFSSFQEFPNDRSPIHPLDDRLEQLIAWRAELEVDHIMIRTDRVGRLAQCSLRLMLPLRDEIIPLVRVV